MKLFYRQLFLPISGLKLCAGLLILFLASFYGGDLQADDSARVSPGKNRFVKTESRNDFNDDQYTMIEGNIPQEVLPCNNSVRVIQACNGNSSRLQPRKIIEVLVLMWSSFVMPGASTSVWLMDDFSAFPYPDMGKNSLLVRAGPLC